MRFYLGCVAFMIVPFLSSCTSGNGVSVVDMGGRKAEYSLPASDSLPGIAGNPSDARSCSMSRCCSVSALPATACLA